MASRFVTARSPKATGKPFPRASSRAERAEPRRATTMATRRRPSASMSRSGRSPGTRCRHPRSELARARETTRSRSCLSAALRRCPTFGATSGRPQGVAPQAPFLGRPEARPPGQSFWAPHVQWVRAAAPPVADPREQRAAHTTSVVTRTWTLNHVRRSIHLGYVNTARWTPRRDYAHALTRGVIHTRRSSNFCEIGGCG